MINFNNKGCLIKGLSHEQVGRLWDLMGESDDYDFGIHEAIIGINDWGTGTWSGKDGLEVVSYDEMIALLEPDDKRRPHYDLIIAWAKGAKYWSLRLDEEFRACGPSSSTGMRM